MGNPWIMLEICCLAASTSVLLSVGEEGPLGVVGARMGGDGVLVSSFMMTSLPPSMEFGDKDSFLGFNLTDDVLVGEEGWDFKLDAVVVPVLEEACGGRQPSLSAPDTDNLSARLFTEVSTVSLSSLSTGLVAPEDDSLASRVAAAAPAVSLSAQFSKDRLDNGDDVTRSTQAEWSECGEVTRSLGDFSPSLSHSSSHQAKSRFVNKSKCFVGIPL